MAEKWKIYSTGSLSKEENKKDERDEGEGGGICVVLVKRNVPSLTKAFLYGISWFAPAALQPKS